HTDSIVPAPFQLHRHARLRPARRPVEDDSAVFIDFDDINPKPRFDVVEGPFDGRTGFHPAACARNEVARHLRRIETPMPATESGLRYRRRDVEHRAAPARRFPRASGPTRMPQGHLPGGRVWMRRRSAT